MLVKIYTFSTHYLKNKIKKTNKISCPKDIKDNFIFSFARLQNSLTQIEFENYLINIYYIFNSIYVDDKLLYALNVISKALKEKKLTN